MEDVKKIIVIGPGAPYRNGQSIFLSHLCNKLNGEFNIELLNFTMLYPFFLFPGTSQYDNSSEIKHSFPNKRMLSSLNPLSWIKVARYINKANADIIAIDWWHPFFGLCMYGLTTLLNKRNKQKVIFITENVISHEANRSDVMLTRLGFRHAQGFLALSQSVEQHLKRMFHKPVFRSALPIYDFYNVDNHNNARALKQELGLKEEQLVFLFFGLVRKYKGLDILLEAFPSILKEVPGAHLLVVGEFYEPQEPYLEIVRKNNLSESVTIVNKYIPNEEVAQYFKVSDCVLMPYRSATQSGILSMAYGFKKPVVVTDVGELSALIQEGKTGIVAPPDNPEAFAVAVTKFVQLKNQQVDFEGNINAYLKEIDVFDRINEVFNDIDRYLNAPDRP